MAVAPDNSPASTPPPTPPVAAPAVPAPPSTPAAPTSAGPAASPTAKLSPQDVHAGLMDAAQRAIKTQGSPSAPTSQGVASTDVKASVIDAVSGASQVPPQGESTSPEAASTEEDDETKPPPFHEHPRWKKMEAKLSEADAAIKELQPDADQYQKIQGYMEKFSLTTDDMVMAYDIVARLRNDPQSAFERLTPIYRKLCEMVGATLPDDLRERISQGFLDEKSARELAKARAAERLATDRAMREREGATKQSQTHVNVSIQQAVADWDTHHTSNDPDFERLRPLVEDTARSIMVREGKAKDPDAAIVMLDRALKVVKDRLAPFRTNGHSPTPRSPNGTGNPATEAVAPEPKTMAEAAMQGLKGNYRFSQ